jgi:ATP-dependent helicase/nuclease subunit B
MSQQSLPFDAPGKSQTALPVYTNLVEYTCELILQQFRDQLPDLSNVHILLSSNNAVATFRSELLNQASQLGYSALLGPHIISLDNWANQQSVVPLSILSEHARELLLVGALQEFPDIYKHSNPWVLAESLMELFDELTLAHLELPKDIDSFKQQIVKAYGATEKVKATLEKEALLVHSLWYAMHQQLSALNCIDRTAASILNLSNSIEHLPGDHKFYYCGIDRPTPSEKKWRERLLARNQLTLITHNPLDFNSDASSDAYIRFLDQVYNTSKSSFYDRTDQAKKLFRESPINTKLRIFATEGSEYEALGIDIQTRRWLLEGKNNIGIVTENRKLARRVRALLERANIKVSDDAGWALSTTSAATVVERWLETIEQDFHYLPFLDFLKSPFVLANNDDYLKTVYQLEKHIVVDENTPNDIAQFLHHIKLRQTKLEDEKIPANYADMEQLLVAINTAAQPLLKLNKDNKEHHASEFIDALLESMVALNIVDAFREDAAGIQLLSEINELNLGAILVPTKMTWVAFRSWLGRTLERFNFKPDPQSSPVKITTLANSEYFNFDACIIAGAERQFLPHNSKVSPFFNDAVRETLNVTTQSDRLSLNYFLFRRLLVSVKTDNSGKPNILITRRAIDNGEEIIASPWIEVLQAFHQQCYGSDLTDTELPLLVADTACQVILDDAPLPSPVEENPSIAVPQSLIPKTISASGYQQLINCPYQFFASRCLELAPAETVKEALQKLDYGNHIHRCLEAFHGNVKDLPGPFGKKITDKNKNEALALLNEISLTVFSSDIDDNFQHRGWLKRWQQTIPLYIEWQMQQEQQYTPVGHEVTIEKTAVAENVFIRGRIDRIDKHEKGIAVLDYKSGKMPKAKEISSGEAVQLPFYLMLLIAENDPKFAQYLTADNDFVSAFYVDLYDTNKVSAKSEISNPELLEIVDKNKHRLIAVVEQLRQGHQAPAWGNVDVCKYCEMNVLCRKQAWSSKPESTTT